MSTLTLDSTIGLSVNEKDHFNEIHTIRTLSVGLRTIADQIKTRERAWETQTAGKVKFHVYGLDIDGTKRNLDILVCLFHWFGVSLCNYARLVGFIRGLDCGDFARSDLKDSAKFKDIKKSVNSYVRGVCELSAVLKWRNKVGAHFAITSPQADDNKATLDMSVMHPVTFTNRRYRVAELTLTYAGASTAPESSEIPQWSVTEVFESLIPRYWPHIKVVTEGDKENES